MLTEQKLKSFMVAGNMEETWETRHILLWKKVPPHSPIEEGSKYFAVSIPIFHHNNLQFSVFITFNNDYGTLFEN